MSGNRSGCELNDHRYNNNKRRKKREFNISLFIAVLITLIILTLVGIYIYLNDTRQSVVLNIFETVLFFQQ